MELQAQVVIVGAGPCGVTLANHLGMYGIETVVLERSREILDYPRAVGADDETLRSWQAVGLAEEALADMVQNSPARYHNSLGRCFAHIRPQGQPFGWPRRNNFMQPLTEATLRRGLQRYSNVRLELGWELQALEQDADGVTLVAGNEAGSTLRVRCAYAVGADGGSSTVRRLIEVPLSGSTHPSKWIVIDVEDDALYAPFAGVYCSPRRPSMVIDLPYGHRRFEYMLLPEDPESDMDKPEQALRMIAPHYESKGLPLPKIQRARIYNHHSRIADRFQAGRVFLAGDAAHLQPPFFGQGMNSGIRDATNLGWKLAAVLQQRAHARILESYGQERRDHALKMVNFATWIGSFYKPRNRMTEALRDAFFDAIQSLPNVRDYILQLRFKPMPRYTEGLVVHDGPIGKGSPVGRMFMQPRVETPDRRKLRLDDAIGNGFAVIGVNYDPASVLGEEEHSFWQRAGGKFVQVSKSRSGGAHFKVPANGTLLLDDVDGGFRDWLSDRPAEEFIVLRPDRYVAGVSTRSRANELTRAVRGMLH